MKNKYIIFFLSAALVAGSFTSCVKDLNVKPIDPNTVLPEDVLCDEQAFTQLLAKCYQGLCVSGSNGQDAGPDIDGIDGGFGQYMRALFNMQELTTDVATCCWNDKTLFDIHNLSWTASDVFVLSMYYRIFYQVSLCNEFIRRARASEVTYDHKSADIAEARALRLLSYYHAIDMFGNVPFTTEENSVGATAPEQISRARLFDWMENEAKDLLSASSPLAAPKMNEYGRCDKGMVMMILAKLYLNAEIWKGTAMYDKCAPICEEIITTYGDLHPEYTDLFCADNHLCTANTTYNGKEIIFAAPQDGLSICSYGSTNFLIFASTGSWGADVGISSGWSGLSLTGAFTRKFTTGDSRALFQKAGQYEDPDTKEKKDITYEQDIDEIRRNSDGWSNGWKSMKFTNKNHDGSAAQTTGFVDTDFPVFRTADAYLMYAECAAREAADATKGKTYLDAVRTRAGVGAIALSLDNIIDERGRELYYEGFRRQDLIRFGMFTTDKYLWEFKGGEPNGKAVDDHFNLFPITSGDLNANGNLHQNPGY